MSEHIATAIGQQIPIDLPEDRDGTPHTMPVVQIPWPLQIILPADIGPAHEQALMQATPDGPIRRLICLQGHQRRLQSNSHPEQMAWLPLIQCSIYLRGPKGPMHQPLHWIATTDVMGWGEPYQTTLLEVMQKLDDQPGQGMPAKVMVTGRGRRLLLGADLAMHNAAALVWARALYLAVSGHSLHLEDFAEQCTVAEADLLPKVQRAGCMRQLMPVAIGGQHASVRGGQMTSWLIDHGWLDPQQLRCDEDQGVEL
jgi:hypothetical protein